MKDGEAANPLLKKKKKKKLQQSGSIVASNIQVFFCSPLGYAYFAAALVDRDPKAVERKGGFLSAIICLLALAISFNHTLDAVIYDELVTERVERAQSRVA